MIRSAVAFGLATLALASVEARADIYRYRDPDTGQIKFTTVAPPWLKKQATITGGPRVDVIREPAPSAGSPAPDGEAAPPQPIERSSPRRELPRDLSELDRMRKKLLAQLVVEAPSVGAEESRRRWFAGLEEMLAVEAKEAQLDPRGRDTRAQERDRALTQMESGFRKGFPNDAATRDFVAELYRWMDSALARARKGEL